MCKLGLAWSVPELEGKGKRGRTGVKSKPPGSLSSATLILIISRKSLAPQHVYYVLSCCLRGPFGTQGSTPISFSVKCRELGVGTGVANSSGGLQPAASSCSEDPQVRTELFTGACLRRSGWPPPKEQFLRNPSPGVTRTPGLCCPHN